jgi:hypothetical protein
MTEAQKPISVREFARRLGVSETAVRKAVAAGKITSDSFTEVNGKRMIIELIARKEWAIAVREGGPPQSAVLAQSLSKENKVETLTPTAKTMMEAKQAKAVWDAKTAELNYRKAEGMLVEKDVVNKSLHEMGQEIRDAMLSIPDRVIDDILAASTRADAHTLLHKAIHDELTRLTDHLEKL